MLKATQAAESARALLTRSDADGACNRAYYAMFDAARAALRVAGHDVGKTHRGVLNAFNRSGLRAAKPSGLSSARHHPASTSRTDWYWMPPTPASRATRVKRCVGR